MFWRVSGPGRVFLRTRSGASMRGLTKEEKRQLEVEQEDPKPTDKAPAAQNI